jgi:hypothetical protein
MFMCAIRFSTQKQTTQESRLKQTSFYFIFIFKSKSIETQHSVVVQYNSNNNNSVRFL